LKYVTILKPQDLQTNYEITCTQFCTIDPHKDRKAMYSSSTKVEYATDITLGRIVRFKKLSSATQKRCIKFFPTWLMKMILSTLNLVRKIGVCITSEENGESKLTSEENLFNNLLSTY
jgi:hypothetical protein